MRQIKKEVIINFDGEDLTFEITKMNAFDGAYLMKFVTEVLLPAIANVQDALVIKEGEENESSDELVKRRVQNVMPMISEALESISKEDLVELMKQCLKTVVCKMPAGPQKVLIGESFGIPELEYDTMNCLLLCYYVIEFNMNGFFAGKRLASILSKVNTSLPSA